MARIAGVDLPRTKRIETGLTYIFGIGDHRASVILKEAGVDPDVRIKDLSEEEVRKISQVIEEQGRVEGDLRKEISLNIKWQRKLVDSLLSLAEDSDVQFVMATHLVELLTRHKESVVRLEDRPGD